MTDNATYQNALTKAITLSKLDPNKSWKVRSNKVNYVQIKSIFGSSQYVQQVYCGYKHVDVSFFGFLSRMTIIAIIKMHGGSSISEITHIYNRLAKKSELLQPYTSPAIRYHCDMLCKSGVLRKTNHAKEETMKRKHKIVYSLLK